MLVATLADQDEKTKIKNIRDKISNILKCEPNKKRIPMILDDNDETH
jgi:GTPase